MSALSRADDDQADMARALVDNLVSAAQAVERWDSTRGRHGDALADLARARAELLDVLGVDA